LDGGEGVSEFRWTVKLIEMLRNVRSGKNISIHYQEPAGPADRRSKVSPPLFFPALAGPLSLNPG